MIESSGIFRNVEIYEKKNEENDGTISRIYYYHAIMGESSAPIICLLPPP